MRHTQQQEQDGRADADLRIGGHQADQEGGHAHDHQRHHQHALAADLVAEVAEDHAAQRPRHKAHGERGVCQQRGDERIVAGEVELVENDARHHAIEEKVVPLDGGADDG
ncbi:hypothetical protein SDC9_62767 [bioreactor metagenome]|uniref:Uncharacterized protein n=1 Tax=bioreactor metagenome TaxID=1076179 RepID=A0A644XKV4_9ZZZZ